MNIPLFKPDLGDEELLLLKEIFGSGWVGLGPKTAQFEREIADYQSRKHAVAMNSCTAALHLALDVLNLPEGSEILVPTVTFVATPHSAEYNKLRPIFVDVYETDLCIDIVHLESMITPLTKAIIPVHMGGQPCAMDTICELARKYNLYVIEDVANAQGGAWKGKKLGSWGHMGALSFEAKKNMTTGDGGMLLFDDDLWLEHIKKMRWVGMNKDTWKRFSGDSSGNYSWYYEVDCLGLKYNMNDIAAAIGLCQIKKLDRNNARKRELIRQYIDKLTGVGDIYIAPYDLDTGAYWLFIIQTPQRDDLIAYLAEHGITCGVHFMPNHLHPYYIQKYGQVSLPQAERVWKKIMTLPLFPSMQEEQLDYVVSQIKDFYLVKK